MGLHVGAFARYFYNGEPLVNGRVLVVEPGTGTTNKAIFSDYDQTVNVPNPALTNENGEITVYWDGLADVVVTTASGIPVAQFKNISVLGEGSGGGGGGVFNVWRTYNSAAIDTPPPVPEGDGTTNGWYRPATAESRWASEKNTVLITDGVWSAPFIIAGIPGNDGANGESPLVGYLTNESHTYAATNNGTVADFSTGNGFFRVFLGLTDVSDQVTFSRVSQENCVVVISSTGAVSVAAMTADEGNAVFRATGFGTSVEVTLSLAKSRAGADGTGADAQLLRLTATSQQFIYDNSSGTPVPLPASQTITFQVSRQNIADAVVWTSDPLVTLTVNGDLATLTIADFGALQSTRITATAAGFSDFITVNRLQSGQDGADGVTPLVGSLTNEAHTYAANSAGVVSDLSTGGGFFRVFLGLQDVSNQALYSVIDQRNCTVTIDPNTGEYDVTSFSADEGSAEFRAIAFGTPLERQLSLAKSRAGVDGDSGSGSKILRLNATAQQFTFDNSTGTAVPNPANQTITFSASRQNITDAVVWSTSPSTTLTINGDQATMTVAAFGANQAVRVTVTAEGQTDFITVSRLQSGQDGDDGADGESIIGGYLTNESHTFPTNASGIVDDFGPGGGTFKMFAGLTDVTVPSAFAVDFETDCDVSINGSGVYTVNSMSADQAIAGFRGIYQGVTVQRVLTLSKSRSSQTITLSASSETFRYNGSTGTDVADPANQTITFTASRQNIPNATIWSSIPNVPLTSNGDTCTLTVANFGANDQVRVIATAGGFVDAKTVIRVSSGTNGNNGDPGTDGVSATLDRTSIVLTDNNGTISYSQAFAQWSVFAGDVNVLAQTTFSIIAPAGSTATVTAGGLVQITSVTAPTTVFTARAVYGGRTFEVSIGVTLILAVQSPFVGIVGGNVFATNLAIGPNVDLGIRAVEFFGIPSPVPQWSLIGASSGITIIDQGATVSIRSLRNTQGTNTGTLRCTDTSTGLFDERQINATHGVES